MAVKWYYKMAGQEIGPFTSQQLKQLAEEKRIAPNDPVRRDTDTEWSVAKNVKGLFPPETAAIPMGTAVPAGSVKAPPVVQPVSAVSKQKPPVAKAVSVSAKPASVPSVKKVQMVEVDEDDSEGVSSLAFDFEASSAPKTPARGGTARFSATGRSARRGTPKTSAPAEDDMAEEKLPLTKKEIQKRNFMICVIATAVVILLAVLILVIVSCSGSDGNKAETLQDEAAVTVPESGEEGSDGEEASKEGEEEGVSEAEDSDSEAGEGDSAKAAHPFIPEEWLSAGYRCPLDEKGGNPKSCTFDSMQVMIRRIETAPLSAWNPNTRAKDKDKKCCFIKIEVRNVNKDGKLMDVPGWGAKGSPAVKLFDDKENLYRTLRYQVPDQADSMDQKAAEESFTDVLIFNAPNLEKVEFLRLVLPAAVNGENDALLFLPKEFLLKKNDEEGKESEEADGENPEDSNAEAADGADDAEKDDGEDDGESAEGTDANDEAEKKEADALSDDALTDDALSENAGDSGTPAPPAVGIEAKELDEATKQEEGLDIFNDPNLNL